MLTFDGPDAESMRHTSFGTKATGRVLVKGEGNRAEIGAGSVLKNVKIEFIGNHNTLILGENCVFSGHILLKGDHRTVKIGRGSTFQSVYLLAHEADITIGDDCMFSREIEVRATDAHSIICRKTGERLNAPGPIVIGDHVWIGLRCIIQKNVTIADDTVIAAGSFVSRSVEESGVIVAFERGKPVVVRRDVTWDRKRVESLPLKKLWKKPQKS